MSNIEELQKRVMHLETEVELLKELVKLQNKCPERIVPTYPPTPLGPYFSKEPTLEPPYKVTCGGEK
jgi:hypothetical protein